MSTKVPENSMSFLFKAAEWAGKAKERAVSQDLFCQIQDYEINSPIEQMFYAACIVMIEADGVAINPFLHADERVARGIFITPQYQIGKYRVDFAIISSGLMPPGQETPIAVELDGHEFHDKDKFQRSYEKARDRFLVREGYKVLHFTGAEVCADPFRVAFDVLSLRGVGLFDTYREYSANDPLELG